MRIKKIVVKNLFGIFDHEIPFNLEDRITIIHGPNGYGKTILLTMLNGFFRSNYHELFRIPFNELSLLFDDGSTLLIQKKAKDNGGKTLEDFEEPQEITKYERKGYKELNDTSNKSKSSLYLKFSRPSLDTLHFTVTPVIRKDIDFPLGMIEEVIPYLARIGNEAWINRSTGEKISLEDVLNRFGYRLPYHDKRRKKEPDWLEKIKKSITIRFIETQRLLLFSQFLRQRDYPGTPSISHAVSKYSEEIVDAIQQILAEYATLSQSLDRTFPTRLVKGKYSSEITSEGLRLELNQLEEKRSRLISAGLLDKEEEIDLREFQEIDERNINVLSVYIEDVKKKLAVFEELTTKIDLLVKIINGRFLYKQMTIDKKEGFIFETSKGNKLPVTKLSSGEQHELVLLYEFLFKVTPNSLILIDEPELSLHVGWQQQFLKDLENITKLSNFDVLIATHSPQIIHERWDLTVKLTGPKDERISHTY